MLLVWHIRQNYARREFATYPPAEAIIGCSDTTRGVPEPRSGYSGYTHQAAGVIWTGSTGIRIIELGVAIFAHTIALWCTPLSDQTVLCRLCDPRGQS